MMVVSQCHVHAHTCPRVLLVTFASDVDYDNAIGEKGMFMITADVQYVIEVRSKEDKAILYKCVSYTINNVFNNSPVLLCVQACAEV